MGALTKLVGVAIACGFTQVAAQSPLIVTLDQVVAQANGKGFDGVVLVGDAERILFEKAIGMADRDRSLNHQLPATWRWASVTKQLTATIVAQLASEGKLDLDQTVSTYLTPAQFSGRDAGRIKIRQLLQHTSGLPNPSDAAGENEIAPFYKRAVTAATVHAIPARELCAGAPKRSPGERLEYNNCDYLVLGAIIETVERKPFDAVLRDRIAKPLGLTTVALARGPKQTRAGKREAVRGYLDDVRVEQPFQLATYGAAGAIIGSPAELMKFNQALMGDTLIKKDVKAKFWTGDEKLGYAALGAWAFPAKLTGCSEPVKLVERRGSIGGVQVRNIIAPEKSRAVIAFTNRGDFEFGEIWQGKGFAHELVSAAVCGDAKP